MSLPFHPLADLFPLIEGADFEALCADIAANGLHQPVQIWRGTIIDGRNRYRAVCRIDPAIARKDAAALAGLTWFVDVSHIHERLLPAHVISLNLHRRHLDAAQRAMIAAKLVTAGHGGARHGGAQHGEADQGANLRLEISAEQAGAMLNVSPRSVDSAKALRREAPAELVNRVERGEVSLHAAQEGLTAARESLGAAGAPISEQAMMAAYDRIRAEKAAAQAEKKARRAAREAALGEKIGAGNAQLAGLAATGRRYSVILADPEWRFEVWSRETGMDRAADNHYPTSPLDEIMARPVGEIAAKDCVLGLWATVPMLPQALAVMAAWGFTYRSHCVWKKDRPGTGYWFINEHELLLIGTRGDVPAPAPGTQARSTWFEAPLGAHSEKPGFAHEMFERLFPSLPRIELNARQARPGWDIWGAEAPEVAADDAPAPDPLDAIISPQECRARREALGLGPAAFARALMMSGASVREFEAGRYAGGKGWREVLRNGLARVEAGQ